MRPLLIVVLGLAVAVPLSAQRQARPPATLLIRNVSVIDGTGAAARQSDVLVRDGIVAGFAAPAGETPTTVIDGAGQFLTPGLMDAHVHLSGDTFGEAAASLATALKGGVTTVFDVAGDTRLSGDLARASLAREIATPTVYYSALFGGAEFMKDPRVIGASLGYITGTAPWQQQIDATTDVAAAVAMARGTGAQAIKLYAALDAATVKRIGVEAAKQHIRLIAHGNVFPAKASDLIDAGVKYLAHAPYLVWDAMPPSTDFTKRAAGDFAAVPADGPAMTTLLKKMKEHDVALNPTLWVLAEGGAKADPSGLRNAWSNTFTRQAQQLGVTISAGVDSLLSNSDTLPMIHRELEMLVAAGLTPLQAITAATHGAAHGIGVDGERGSIAIGQRADFLLLSKDPTTDIRNTRAIVRVIKDGKVVKR